MTISLEICVYVFVQLNPILTHSYMSAMDWSTPKFYLGGDTEDKGHSATTDVDLSQEKEQGKGSTDDQPPDDNKASTSQDASKSTSEKAGLCHRSRGIVLS